MMRNSLAFIAGEGASEFFGNLRSYSGHQHLAPSTIIVDGANPPTPNSPTP